MTKIEVAADAGKRAGIVWDCSECCPKISRRSRLVSAQWSYECPSSLEAGLARSWS